MSWSQSSLAETTRCTLPLVPPLCHSSRRLRLQKCASPVASVAPHGLLVRVGDHEDLPAAGGLDDAGHEAVGAVAHELEEGAVVHDVDSASPVALVRRGAPS